MERPYLIVDGFKRIAVWTNGGAIANSIIQICFLSPKQVGTAQIGLGLLGIGQNGSI